MHFQKGRITLFQRVSLYTGYVLFLGLFSLLALKLADQWIYRNPYLMVVAGVFVVSLSAALIAGVSRLSPAAARLRQGVFLLTITATLLFVILTPLPITSVMIDVRQVPQSMEFFLMHHDDDKRDKWRSVYKTRGDTLATVSFMLPQPIQGRDRGLMIYMGRNPHQVHFGRYPPPVDIYKVSYGTDFFRLPLPMAVYEEGDLLTPAGVVVAPESSSLVNHAVRVSKMEIMWDEARVRKDSGPVRVMLIKLLWVICFTGMSAMILWAHSWTPKAKPLWKAIENYMTYHRVE